MASPKKFAAGFAGGLLLILAAFGAAFQLQLGVPTQSSEWCWQLNTRKQQLAEAAGTPKLLLVGGSSTLFGLKARDIQARTQIPAVNLGTHAALGADYILHLARKCTRPGDTVLLCLEYELYSDSSVDELFLDYLLSRDPGYFHSLPFSEQIQMGMAIPWKRLKQGLRSRGKVVRAEYRYPYDIACINESGDQIGATIERRPPGKPYLARLSECLVAGAPSDSRGLRAVASFVSWAKSHQVRVLATFPAICPRREYESAPAQQTLRAVESFYASLGVPLLGDAQEAMLDPELFFDTLYHLTEEGARERTRRLLIHLTPLLPTTSRHQGASGPTASAVKGRNTSGCLLSSSAPMSS